MAQIIEISNLSIPQLDVYARLSEVQLRHFYEPNGGLFIAESPVVIGRALDAGYVPVSLLVEKRLLAEKILFPDKGQASGLVQELLVRCGDIPAYTADEAVLAKLTGYALTRGMLCAMQRKELPTVEEICTGARRIAVLENVMNPTNVGAIFRSAAALGMDAVLLTPACSDPLYRRAVRVSMGTVFQIPWTYFGKEDNIWPQRGMELLHGLGFRTAAMALSEDAIHIDDPALLSEEKLAVVLGTEGDGLAPATIAACDYTVKIPMSHGVDSLNVAAASAVAFWQLGRVEMTGW